jgi:hypothetical protein
VAEPVDVREKAIAASMPPPELMEARALELEPEDAAAPAHSPADAGVRHRGEAVAGERWIARVLRTGAVVSGGLFLGSLALELLPQSTTTSVAIDSMRKAGASLLLVTPVARLVVAGTALGLKGEWRYTLYAAGVLGLLAVAVGAGFAA